METITGTGMNAGTHSRTAVPAPVDAVRTRLLAVALGVAAVAVVPLQLLWLKPSDGQQFSFADVAPDRELFWLVVGLFAAISVVSLPLQALATMHLVKERGSTWATVGGALLWVGCGLQAAGVATWASLYYFATDPAISEEGRAVIASANGDDTHLYGLLFPGVVLVTVGVVIQCVGLFRAHVVPVWIPIGLLFMVVTFVVPSTGATGLISTVPMTAGALGLAAFVLRGVRAG